MLVQCVTRDLLHLGRDGMCSEVTIRFSQPSSELIWNRLKGVPGLVEDLSDLEEKEASEYSTITTAKLITLFQIIAFGDNGRHSSVYGSKLGRNLYLSKVNSEIMRLLIEDQPHSLVLDLGKKKFIISLGNTSGYTVAYPLNKFGANLYLENQLSPCRFEQEHLIGSEHFHRAALVFIGGALYLPMVEQLNFGIKPIRPDENSSLLWEQLWNHTLSFLPTRTSLDLTVGNPQLIPENGYGLPMIATAFSGKGFGEHLARDIGFVRDRHGIDHISKDRRYIFDLHEVNFDHIRFERKLALLKHWEWYLEWIGEHQEEQSNIRYLADLLRQNHG